MQLYNQYGKEVESAVIDAVPPADISSKKTQTNSPYFEPFYLRPFDPNVLYNKRGDYSLHDEMREDDQINAVLTLKKLLIIDSKWEIEVDDEENETSIQIKDFIEDNFKMWIDELFEKKLFNILSAKDYGFSVTEKIWGNKDGKIIIEQLRTRYPGTFIFKQNDFGDVVKIIQRLDEGDKPIDPKKFIHYANMKEFDIPYGRTEFNTGVYRAWYSKVAIIKFWNMYLERHGMPPIVATYPNTMVQYKSEVETILKNLQAKTGITVPEGFTLELLEEKSKQGESGYERAIDKYNTMIARSMLVPDLTGMSGSETGGGSYSLGQEQFGMMYAVIEQDRRQLERIVTRELVDPLVLWNFGSQYQAKFVFKTVDEKKKLEQSKTYLDALKTGKVEPTLQQLNHFFSALDYPELEKKEWEEQQTKKEEMMNSMQEGMNNEDTSGDKQGQNKQSTGEGKQSGDKTGDTGKSDKVSKGKEIPKDGKSKDGKDAKNFRKSEYSREYTKFESKENITATEKGLNEIEDKYTTELQEAWNLSINALINDIRRKKIIEKKKIEQVGKLQLRHLNKIEGIYKSMAKESAVFGKQSVPQPTKNFAINDIPPELNNEDIVKWFDVFIKDIILTTEGDYILNHVKPIVMDGIEDGLSVKDMAKQSREALKGYTSATPHRIETSVRTLSSKAFNEGRDREFRELSDFIQGFQFSAIMDGRTSDICTQLDEKVFPPDEADYYKPPLHFNCRSLLVPVFIDEEMGEFDKMPATEAEPGGFKKLVK